jgi:hypothetical protein
LIDAVADQIEESDISRCIAQRPQERGTFGRKAFKLTEIENRQSTDGKVGSGVRAA